MWSLRSPMTCENVRCTFRMRFDEHIGQVFKGFMAGSSRSKLCALKKAEQQIRKRRGEKGAVDDVEDSAEAGDEAARVFDVGVALHEAFEEVAELADAAGDDAEDDAFGPGEA